MKLQEVYISHLNIGKRLRACNFLQGISESHRSCIISVNEPRINSHNSQVQNLYFNDKLYVRDPNTRFVCAESRRVFCANFF